MKADLLRTDRTLCMSRSLARSLSLSLSLPPYTYIYIYTYLFIAVSIDLSLPSEYPSIPRKQPKVCVRTWRDKGRIESYYFCSFPVSHFKNWDLRPGCRCFERHVRNETDPKPQPGKPVACNCGPLPVNDGLLLRIVVHDVGATWLSKKTPRSHGLGSVPNSTKPSNMRSLRELEMESQGQNSVWRAFTRHLNHEPFLSVDPPYWYTIPTMGLVIQPKQNKGEGGLDSQVGLTASTPQCTSI